MDKVRVTFAKNFRTTADGFKLIFYEMVLYAYILIAVLLGLLLMLVIPKTSSLMIIIIILLLPTAFAGFLAAIFGIIGRVRCLSIPKEVGASHLIQISVTALLIGLVLGILGAFKLLGNPAPAYLDDVTTIIGLVSQLFFLLFLKKLAEFLESEDIQAKVKLMFILLGASFLAAFLMPIVGGSVFIFTLLVMATQIASQVLFAYIVYYTYNSIMVLLNPNFQKSLKRGKKMSGERRGRRKTMEENAEDHEEDEEEDEAGDDMEEEPQQKRVRPRLAAPKGRVGGKAGGAPKLSDAGRNAAAKLQGRRLKRNRDEEV